MKDLRSKTMDKPVDKSKVDARTNAFMEFLEKELNVKFIDVTGEVEDKPTNLDCVADGKGKISFPTTPAKKEEQ